MQQDLRETQTWRVLLLVPGQAGTLALNLSLLSLTFLIPVPAHGLMPQAPLHHMKRCPTGLIWIIEMKVRDQLRVLGGLWYTCKYFALQHGLSSHSFFFFYLFAWQNMDWFTDLPLKSALKLLNMCTMLRSVKDLQALQRTAWKHFEVDVERETELVFSEK